MIALVTAIVLGVVGIGTGATRLGMRIRENRQAKKAGKPKPHRPGDLVLDGLDLAKDAAKTASGIKR